MSLRIVAAACGAAWLVSSPNTTLAQSIDPKATEHTQAGESKEPKKIDEFAEAEKVLGGPAASPECVWLGRRVVSLLWRDDLDTAFRHLDIYDRFGCPAGHIQAAFRCVIKQGNIDPKAPETLNGRVHSCWINPDQEAPAAPSPATAAAAPTANH